MGKMMFLNYIMEDQCKCCGHTKKPPLLKREQLPKPKPKPGSIPKPIRRASASASANANVFAQGITLTFGEVAENHTGMQMIGEKSDQGLHIEDLIQIEKMFNETGYTTELIDLVEHLPKQYHSTKGMNDARVLVVRGGLQFFLSEGVTVNDFYNEQLSLDPDTKFWDRRSKSVKNKRARYNLCFDVDGQNANYETGKGTIVALGDVPLLKYAWEKLNDMVTTMGYPELKVEGNYYYNPDKCGIGYHGDTERRMVIAFRIGADIPLTYRWYYQSKQVSETIRLNLHHGDIYFMSDKATGFDWRFRSHITLRHAAGCKTYTE